MSLHLKGIELSFSGCIIQEIFTTFVENFILEVNLNSPAIDLSIVVLCVCEFVYVPLKNLSVFPIFHNPFILPYIN